MDIAIKILIWIHLIAFVESGGASIAGPVIVKRIKTAPDAEKAGYYAILNRLNLGTNLAVAAMLVSGVLILWLKYGFAGIGAAFWIKMVLVAVLLGTGLYGERQFGASQAGDDGAGARAAVAHRIWGWAFVLIMLASVFAFR